MALAAQTCINHPGRPGAALCMECRKIVCQECATHWNGVNYCLACLKKKRVHARERSPVLAWLVMCAMIAGLLYAGSFLLAWVGVITLRLL
jgi:hypothetical protein